MEWKIEETSLEDSVSGASFGAVEMIFSTSALHSYFTEHMVSTCIARMGEAE